MFYFFRFIGKKIVGNLGYHITNTPGRGGGALNTMCNTL